MLRVVPEMQRKLKTTTLELSWMRHRVCVGLWDYHWSQEGA